ncbi:MAG: MarR family transcriptional regulator [Roseateles sp.]
MTLGVSLSILDRAYRAAANQAVAHVGLSQSMAWPLVMIGRHGEGMRQGVLAELLGIEGPSLARSLDQLVAGGFVERREDSADRRAKTMHLTEAGADACAQIEGTLRTMREELYEGVSDADLQACLRVFTVMQGRLNCPQPVVPPLPDDVCQ